MKSKGRFHMYAIFEGQKNCWVCLSVLFFISQSQKTVAGGALFFSLHLFLLPLFEQVSVLFGSTLIIQRRGMRQILDITSSRASPWHTFLYAVVNLLIWGFYFNIDFWILDLVFEFWLCGFGFWGFIYHPRSLLCIQFFLLQDLPTFST